MSLKQRNKQLDFVKGILVVQMLFYHIGAFSIDNAEFNAQFRSIFLDFVSGSWVFISGLIVIIFYSQWFADNKLKISGRLFYRGMKIIILFASLNILIWAMQLNERMANADTTFVINTIFYGGGAVSFEILLGIGYTLLLSPFILMANGRGVYLAGTMLAILIVLPLFSIKLSPNAWIVACGLLGMVFGFLVKRLSKFYQNSRQQNFVIIIASLVLMIIYYTLRLKFHFGKGDLFIYVLGIVANIMIFYSLHPLLNGKFKLIEKTMLLLGKHSLASYIGQMTIIWIWVAIMQHYSVNNSYLFDFILISLLTIFTIFLIEKLSCKSIYFNKLYKIIFQ